MGALLFDLDGVIYQAGKPIEGARQTIAWVRKKGIAHLFLTNTSSRPRSALVERLARMGIEADESQILTPSVVAADWLRRRHAGPVALFVPEATQAEFTGLPLLDPGDESGAAAVVVGFLGEQWDFARLNRAFRLLMEEPRPQLIALGMSRYWRASRGLSLDVAPFVVALEHAAGVQARVLGKPAPEFFRAALETLGTPAEQTFMVGDDIRGDIEGAQRAGLQGLLVRTGKFRPTDLGLEVCPEGVLDSVADLPAWWESRRGS
ncbi:hydrolase [Desulfuromonas versatilis]|uniref:Haloacid dehalogenase-like hydrolase domain-containing protein 2 n=1 Tax=Desulfuromonas versatilis TaxID=2802975 RepID=A0ABN6DV86_9BACT|nr:TIGR01458 family HAD-type hydrolase [Desulfuromonas versatilis]BCR04018.1 hydrolase [Desulfuromonas versatilis]